MKIIEKIKSLFKKKPLEVTEWYPTQIKPVYKGYYEVRSKTFGSLFLMWDGENWVYSDNTVCLIQERNWRGIKK